MKGLRAAPCLLIVCCLLSVSCLLSVGCSTPSVQITTVPEAAVGGAGRMEKIAGRATGVHTGEHIVLFAKSGTWWVQPVSSHPYTAIRPDLTWETNTHMGSEYAALLVSAGYIPPRTTDNLPPLGNGVIALATVRGKPGANMATPPPKRLHFSGYDWEVLQLPGDSGGVMHINSPSNAWIDPSGALHLQIARNGDTWTCAEVILQRSLGYGTYSFHLAQGKTLEPGSVLGMFTWDDPEAGQNHREIDIELSQWGDRAAKNAQYTIQPFYVPANVYRFDYPNVPLVHSFRWTPGRVEFETIRRRSGGGAETIAAHTFTSGIPTPGTERVHLNLYIYGKSRTLQQEGAEVILDRFEYLP